MNLRFVVRAALVLAVVSPPPVRALQLSTPPTWRWVTDAPDSAFQFVAMPPGWHITAGPGMLLYDPANVARGRYAVETEIFLFPGTSPGEHGVFLAGTGLDGAPEYVAFLIRRDGGVAVERRSGGTVTPLVPWSIAAAVQQPSGSDAVKNTLRIGVEADSLRFDVNGARVATLARGDWPLDGVLGFRVGAATNLHITSLDVTQRLAPPRRAR
jgi:hypothetical protein